MYFNIPKVHFNYMKSSRQGGVAADCGFGRCNSTLCGGLRAAAEVGTSHDGSTARTVGDDLLLLLLPRVPWHRLAEPIAGVRHSYRPSQTVLGDWNVEFS